MSRLLNSIPDIVHSFEPFVSSCLITDLSPDTLLHIQPGLIRRQIFQPHTLMGFEKSPDFISLVPTGPINIQPNRIALEPTVEMSQTLQESFPVAFGDFDHALASQQGSYPTDNVQSFPMLACRWDSQSFSPFSPTSTCPGMQTKARFVLINYSLLGPQTTEFFLKLFGISGHPWHELANTNNSLASPYTQADASTVGPGESLSLLQVDALNAQLRLAHPSGLDAIQTPTATSLNLSLISSGYFLLIYSAALFRALTVTLLILARLLHASTDSNSVASNLKRRLSNLAADPPESATRPLSSILPRPQAFSSHRLSDAPESPLDALKIMSDSSCINITIALTIRKFIYDVCINMGNSFLCPQFIYFLF